MSQLGQSLSDLLSTSGEDRKDLALMQASMAAAALVATAEGDVTFAERATLDQAIAALASRGGGEPHVAVAAFEDFVESIRANSNQGRWPALAAVTALDGAAEAIAIVLRIAEAVAAADGSASTAERTVVAEIAAALNQAGAGKPSE